MNARYINAIPLYSLAQTSAVINSIVETARANQMKIYEYPKYLLTRIPKHMDDIRLIILDGILPWLSIPPEIADIDCLN